MFNFTQEQQEQLSALKATAHFSHRGGTNRNEPAIVICQLLDASSEPKATLKNAFARGEGHDEPSALADALANVNPSERPMSPAQQLQELRRLREESELRDKELAELKLALEAKTNSAKPPQRPESDNSGIQRNPNRQTPPRTG